jgi:D-alanine-D-alanine ligase
VTTQKIAVVYGSRSPEHEVSIITALQVMRNLDATKYQVVPIYITKSGQWLLGNTSFLNPDTYTDLSALNKFPHLTLDLGKLVISKSNSPVPIDVIFPVFHGPFGEDGTVQGLLELLNYPYVGCSVPASALGMDKILQKQTFTAAGLPQVKYLWFYRTDWHSNQPAVLKQLTSLKYPVYVKPANGGSSIGTTKAKSEPELIDAIEVACLFDRKVIVEQSAEGFKEINISVLGTAGSPLQTSVCEQPVATSETLTFSDKYESGAKKQAGMASAQRLIPAPIKPTTASKIADLAKAAFLAIDASGVSRLDFLVSPDEKTIYINEINTIPGSLSFYLWNKTDLPFPQLLDTLIDLAVSRHKDRSRTTTTFSNNLLANISSTLGSKK